MVIARFELLSMLSGSGWLLFHLGRWVERRKQRDSQ